MINISPAGAVGNTQNYNGSLNEWAPDYTLSPLVLCPSVKVIDPDARSSSDVTANLADVVWCEVSQGVETAITGNEASPHDATKKKYTLGTAANGWRLQLNANINPGEKLSLRFKAKYLDTRKSSVLVLSYDCVVFCHNETVATPVLVVDFPETSKWDPIYHASSSTVKIKAKMMLPSGEVPSGKTIFVWDMLRDDGSWSAIGSSILDNEVSVNSDGSELTLDRSIMGTRIDLRVRAKFDPDGNPSSVTLDDTSPEKRISCVRELCAFDYENTTPRNVPPDSTRMRLSCIIFSAKGNLPTPERELEFIWYTATNATSPSYAEIGRGQNIDVSTSFVTASGGMTAVEVKDRGPLKYLRLPTGEYLTVDGKLLMARGG